MTDATDEGAASYADHMANEVEKARGKTISPGAFEYQIQKAADYQAQDLEDLAAELLEQFPGSAVQHRVKNADGEYEDEADELRYTFTDGTILEIMPAQVRKVGLPDLAGKLVEYRGFCVRVLADYGHETVTISRGQGRELETAKRDELVMLPQ